MLAARASRRHRMGRGHARLVQDSRGMGRQPRRHRRRAPVLAAAAGAPRGRARLDVRVPPARRHVAAAKRAAIEEALRALGETYATQLKALM